MLPAALPLSGCLPLVWPGGRCDRSVRPVKPGRHGTNLGTPLALGSSVDHVRGVAAGHGSRRFTKACLGTVFTTVARRLAFEGGRGVLGLSHRVVWKLGTEGAETGRGASLTWATRCSVTLVLEVLGGRAQGGWILGRLCGDCTLPPAGKRTLGCSGTGACFVGSLLMHVIALVIGSVDSPPAGFIWLGASPDLTACQRYHWTETTPELCHIRASKRKGPLCTRSRTEILMYRCLYDEEARAASYTNSDTRTREVRPSTRVSPGSLQATPSQADLLYSQRVFPGSPMHQRNDKGKKC